MARIRRAADLARAIETALSGADPSADHVSVFVPRDEALALVVELRECATRHLVMHEPRIVALAMSGILVVGVDQYGTLYSVDVGEDEEDCPRLAGGRWRRHETGPLPGHGDLV